LNCRSFRPGYRSSPGGPVGFDQVVTCASIRRDRTCPYRPGAEPEVDAVDVEVVLEDQQARGGQNADVILTEPPLAVTFVLACGAVDSARPLHLFRGHFPNVLANGAPLGLPGEVRGPDHTGLVPT
jgi:hypothetical protein